MRIFITGTTGESLPPPYAGIPKLTLLFSRLWKQLGHEMIVTFGYKHDHEDDLGADAQYFFEYAKNPTKLDKVAFLLKYFFKNPALYFDFLKKYRSADAYLNREIILYTAYGVWLNEIVEKTKPDIILGEAALIKSFMAGLVAQRHNIPFVVDTYAEIHDLSMGVNKRMNDEQRKKYWDYYFDLMKGVIAPSEFCANGPRTYTSREKVKVVFPGIDVELCQKTAPGDTKEKNREHFKLPQEEFLVSAVGAFTPRKGHDHLIRAVGKLRKQGFPVSGVLCGPGDSSEWKRIAAEEGVVDHIYFFTALSDEDLVRLYHAVDLYCDASNSPRACLGMSLTESMAAGLPVVAYDHGGLPEVVHDHKNGLLAPVNNIDQLAEVINKIRLMPTEERQKFGEVGRRMAKEMVDLQAVADKKIAVLKQWAGK